MNCVVLYLYQAAREEALVKKMEEELARRQGKWPFPRGCCCQFWKEQRFSAELQRWAEQQQEANALQHPVN